MVVHWKPEKSLWLQVERGLAFEEIEEALARGGLKAILENVSRPEQRVLVVAVRGDIWAVPASVKAGALWLWTAFPSRKLRKIYGGDS